MEILSFEGSNGPSKRKRGKNFVAIATIVALGFTGSTFAASVTLNGGGSLEYGQGVSQAVACASDLVVTPSNSFVNGTPGSFKLQTIKVQDSSTVTTSATVGLGKCIGKKIKIAAYDASNSTALTMDSGTAKFCEVSITGFSSSALQGSVSNCVASYTALAKGFEITITTPTLSAADIFKLTLESF